MDEGSRNLVQTCDAFVSTLDEIMELTEASHLFAVASNRVGDSYNGSGGGSRRSAAARRSRTASVGNGSSNVDGGFQSLFANDGDLALYIPEEEEVTTSKSAATSPRVAIQ